MTDTPVAASEMMKAVTGLDASRRVGWARYYEAVEDATEERQEWMRTTVAWMVTAVALAVQVTYHNRLEDEDPLVKEAAALLNRVGSTPFGHRLIEDVKKDVL